MHSPRLPDLVDALVRERGVKFNDAARAVYVMWKRGQLDLVDESPPGSLAGYMLNFRSLWFWGVTALVAATVPLVLYVTGPPLIYARYVLGAFFILFLPGSMLVEALYSKAGDLEGLERLALSVGLSLAVVPLIGLVLNYTPWGIRLEPVTFSLALFTEAMAVAASVRKYRYFRLGLVGKDGSLDRLAGAGAGKMGRRTA